MYNKNMEELSIKTPKAKKGKKEDYVDKELSNEIGDLSKQLVNLLQKIPETKHLYNVDNKQLERLNSVLVFDWGI